MQQQQATTPSAHRRCGALATAGGGVRWRVWAPLARAVELVLVKGSERRGIAMRAEEEGYFSHDEPRIGDGQLYAYRLDGAPERPDPCSLWQPQDVAGPSAVYRPGQFQWTDGDWRGVPRARLTIYELHVGTFTAEGTFDAVIARLPALRELGITAIEVMPVAQFPGERNWGYDGVLPYAAQHSYGGPAGLQRLVDAAHRAGLAVILDVVYNHMGPEGNFLREFGPYFTDRYKTPWGQAINFDDAGSDGVRDYVLDNARMWLDEFRLDGLRLDAVHAIYDMGARHVLRAIKEVADEVALAQGREVHVIGESDLNDPRVVLPPQLGGHGLGGQWADDFHHTVHALLTGERRGYYSDFGEPQQLARVLETPFLYAWDYSAHRRRKHGAPLPAELSGDHFVICVQNHDQVGNRAKGDRLTTLLDSPAKQRLAACLMLLSPYVPLLFMGEEYAEDRPFPFFCSFAGPELIQAVRDGRRREFAEFLNNPEEIPDPDAVETFNSAKLSWRWPAGSARAGVRQLYRDLLHARQSWPAMLDYHHRAARLVSENVLELVRGGREPGALGSVVAHFNLTDRRQPLPPLAGTGLAVLLRSESTSYGGGADAARDGDVLLPWECVVRGDARWYRAV